MELYNLPAHTMRDMIQQKKITCVELLDAVLKRIHDVEPEICSFLTITEDTAYISAQETDKKIAKGENVGVLSGIPVAIKDNICTKGVATTCASNMLHNFVPVYDATVVERLKNQGAFLLGKTNMDEFGMGSSTENSAFQVTKNPYNIKKVPGGSSGGSATAVAVDTAPIALGTDTGGSIRQPASFCGCVGLKPTYGTVSRYGLVAFASSMDQIGPVAKDVADAAMMLDVIAGHDPKDATSVNRKYPCFSASLSEDIRGIRIGLPDEFFEETIDAEILSAVHTAVDNLVLAGAVASSIQLPLTKYALPAYYLISSAEASANLARFDGVKYGYRAKEYDTLEEMYCRTRSEGFGSEVKRRILLGTFALSAGYVDAYYKKAQQVREKITEELNKALEHFDILITPVAPTTAFNLGEKANPTDMYAGDMFTVSASLAGLPAIVLPCGYDKGGLPIGIQIIGRRWDEKTLLSVAFALEKTVTKHRPNL